jgi:hypothetical protein
MEEKGFDSKKLTLLKKKHNLPQRSVAEDVCVNSTSMNSSDLKMSHARCATTQDRLIDPLPPTEDMRRRTTIESMKQSCVSANAKKSSVSAPPQTSNSSAVVPRSGQSERKTETQAQTKTERETETQPQTQDSTIKSKLVIQWTCDECHHSCIPVRSESRCLWSVLSLPLRICSLYSHHALLLCSICSLSALSLLCSAPPPPPPPHSGHRHKEHKFNPQTKRAQCQTKSCSCQHFYFIVAEGAWILRCRCKHKHIDHDPTRPPFLCKKNGCNCSGFDRFVSSFPSLSQSLSLSVSLSSSLPLCLSLSLSVSLSLSLCLSLYLCLTLSLSVCLSLCL